MRNLYQKLEQSELNDEAHHDAEIDAATPKDKAELERRKTGKLDGVGDLDEAEEFGIGLAPK